MQVAVYARVSTQRQAQAQSTDQQLDRLRVHAEGQGRGAGLDPDGGSRLPRRRLQRRQPAAARARSPARRRRDRPAGPHPDHRAGPAGAQLRAPGPPGRGAAEAGGGGRLPRPADGPRPARPAAAADPRRGGRVRAQPDRRAHAPRPPAQAARRHPAALDAAALRLPARSRAAPRDPAGVRLDEAEAAAVRDLFAGFADEGATILAIGSACTAWASSRPGDAGPGTPRPCTAC